MTEQLIQIEAPNIIIKKQNVILDATVLTALMNCERYLDLRFNRNLIPINGNSNALEAGIVVHKILEEYTKALLHGDSRNVAIQIGMAAGDEAYKIAENVPEDNVLDKQGKVKFVGYQWIIATMQQYFERWKNDSWTPIESEKVHGQVVYEDEEVRVLWKAKLDRIVDTFQDGILPVDHKSMKMNRDTIKLNNQFMGQCLVAKTRKVCIDKIGWQRSLKPEEKFLRVMINYTDQQLAEQIGVIGYYAKTLINLREQGYYPPRYTYCDKYNGCMYRRDICESNPDDRERMIQLHYKVGESWDPTNPDDED